MNRFGFLALALLFVGATAAAQMKTVESEKDHSSITYQLTHPLHHIEATSKDGWFRIEADPGKKEIKSVSAQVDVMTFDSGNSNRDSHAMEVIESIKYPDAVFLGTAVTQNGDSIKVAGKLTFHGVTNDIVMAGVTKWSGDKLEVKGGFEVSLEAYKIARPSLLMIPVEDALRFSMDVEFAF